MKILSIGNSFSQDAHAYLHNIAASMGIELECLNLYIGGCSLETHADNLKNDAKAYSPEYNGIPAPTPISIKDALTACKYDAITLQQASHFSGKYETYFPHLRILFDACREFQPDAEILIHETWAYEIDSTHSAFPDYGSSQRQMYLSLREAYRNAADELGVGIIPVGDCVQYFRENIPEFDYKNGGVSLNRDGFHLSIPLGRMLASYVWIEKICSADVRTSDYIPAGTSEKDAALLGTIRENVHNYINFTQV
ncbi:MAG: DUF4886 domain-containing protein [Eubacteriales bacterium]